MGRSGSDGRIGRRVTKAALAALVLPLAVGSSASASSGGTDRPISGTGAGINVLTFGAGPATATFEADEVATVSHLGESTIHVEGISVLSDTGQPQLSGTATLVAADGDELGASFTGSGVVGGAGGALEITATVSGPITGGTGRFDDARGTITDRLVLVFTDVTPPVLVADVRSELRGTISY